MNDLLCVQCSRRLIFYCLIRFPLDILNRLLIENYLSACKYMNPPNSKNFNIFKSALGTFRTLILKLQIIFKAKKFSIFSKFQSSITPRDHVSSN